MTAYVHPHKRTATRNISVLAAMKSHLIICGTQLGDLLIHDIIINVQNGFSYATATNYYKFGILVYAQ